MTTVTLDEITLAHGAHPSRDDGVCAMEAVAWLAGEPHSDAPSCASPAITAFLISWNDSLDDQARQMLKPWLPKVIGTRTTAEDEEIRAWMATDWLVRVFTPAWLQKANLNEHAQALRDLPELSDAALTKAAMPIIAAAQKDAAAARDAAWDAARDAARDAAQPHKTYSEAYAAAKQAARPILDAAFADTVKELQQAAFELLDRMIQVGKTEETEAA